MARRTLEFREGAIYKQLRRPYHAVGWSADRTLVSATVSFLSAVCCSFALLPSGPKFLASFRSTPKVNCGSIHPILQRRHVMGKKLYVGNLSYDVDSSALEQLFGAHGTVTSAQIIADRDTGQSKGFGFVEMSSDAEAQAAIAALGGQQHGGRALTVNEAKPKENR